MSVTAKHTDKGLSGMQGYVLDAAVPLVNLLESARNSTLTPNDAAESAQQALKLIGNASAHLSAERHRKVATCLNKELLTLVDQEDTSVDAALFLFGSLFQQKMKEHMEAIRNLKQTSTSYGHGQLFGRAIPHSLEVVAAAAAAGAGVRENPRLATSNKCTCFEQTNKCLKYYECSKSCNDTHV